MKRLVLYILLALLPSVFLPSAAQNNAFKIDDECYELYLEAQKSIGADSCARLIQKLIDFSREKGDEKSETLAYTLYPFHYRKLGDDVDFFQSLEDIKAVALRTGYMQY